MAAVGADPTIYYLEIRRNLDQESHLVAHLAFAQWHQWYKRHVFQEVIEQLV